MQTEKFNSNLIFDLNVKWKASESHKFDGLSLREILHEVLRRVLARMHFVVRFGSMKF